jgi:lipopolysaccharide/colanic/teichoic acid biosynthesis glycosyltransferase
MTLHFTPIESGLDSSKSRVKNLDKGARRAGFYRKSGKRALDILLTVLLAPFVVPFIFVSALLIALDGHNPFYSQLRIGKGGKTFRMWKLRTMVHDADALLDAYLAENPVAKLEWDSTQKLKKDPRITLIGRILRKTSLDELPQLWNVVNGSMSIVGPRPMMVSQRDSYFGEGYFRLQPGITGLWQVSDRNEGEFVGRVRYDDMYDRKVSLRTDLWVLFRTVGVVIRCTGY